MLTRPQNLAVNLCVQMVWRAVMHHVQIRMGEQRLNVPVSMGHIQLARLFLRL